jgi:hypothetical protein
MSSNFSHGYNWLKNNANVIVALAIILSLIGFLVYILFRFGVFVYNLNGFTFDPVLIISLIFVAFVYFRSQKQNQELVNRQNEILQSLYEKVEQQNLLESKSKLSLPGGSDKKSKKN